MMRGLDVAPIGGDHRMFAVTDREHPSERQADRECGAGSGGANLHGQETPAAACGKGPAAFARRIGCLAVGGHAIPVPARLSFPLGASCRTSTRSPFLRSADTMHSTAATRGPGSGWRSAAGSGSGTPARPLGLGRGTDAGDAPGRGPARSGAGAVGVLGPAPGADRNRTRERAGLRSTAGVDLAASEGGGLKAGIRLDWAWQAKDPALPCPRWPVRVSGRVQNRFRLVKLTRRRTRRSPAETTAPRPVRDAPASSAPASPTGSIRSLACLARCDASSTCSPWHSSTDSCAGSVQRQSRPRMVTRGSHQAPVGIPIQRESVECSPWS